jgi:hypothetical protein
MPESSAAEDDAWQEQITYPDLGKPKSAESSKQGNEKQVSNDGGWPMEESSKKGKQRQPTVEDDNESSTKTKTVTLPRNKAVDGDVDMSKNTAEDPASESEASDTEKATRYTRKQRKAVSRVLRRGETNYYGILDLDENCSEKDITKAYRSLSFKTHPDKNQYKDAEVAFKREYARLVSSDEKESAH